MAKQSFTGLFDNMPTVDSTMTKKETVQKTPPEPASVKKEEDKGPEEKTQPKETGTRSEKEAAEQISEEKLLKKTSTGHGALPFLKEQKDTEKKNQTFYIPVYLHERLKESAEMYNMTVSGVLTEILKSVYNEN